MTITPGNWNFRIYQGASWIYTIIYTTASGTPIDLTGYSAQMMCRSDINAVVPFLDMSTTNDLITLGGSAGTITFSLTPAQTAALFEGTGIYDLKLTNPSGEQDFLIQGAIAVQLMSTR